MPYKFQKLGDILIIRHFLHFEFIKLFLLVVIVTVWYIFFSKEPLKFISNQSLFNYSFNILQVFLSYFSFSFQAIGFYLSFHVLRITMDSEEILHSKQKRFWLFIFIHLSIKWGCFGFLKFLWHMVSFLHSLMVMMRMEMTTHGSNTRMSKNMVFVSTSCSFLGTQWWIPPHSVFTFPSIPLLGHATIFPICSLLLVQRALPNSMTSP